ncbi:MAG: NAD-dependent epimerase/dehydratase family protein [Treponema sp.]|nr:NAD-dependent epimerase/dehydratase family protein [Treponema sp.]
MGASIYLVTGAAGFLGGTVARKLAERGAKVRAFVLPGDKAAKYIPQSVEIVEGDLCDISALERFFSVPEGTDIFVLHIASIVTVNPEFSQVVYDVNVGGTKNIIELCVRFGVKKLVYCSSVGAIPEVPKGRPVVEVSQFSEKLVVGCYNKTKAAASQLVLDAAARGLDASIVHPTGIMGPEDFAVGHTTKTLLQIIRGEMPAGINGSFNLADVRDLAEGIILCCEKGTRGECYILGNRPVTFKAFAKMVCAEAGCRKIRFFLPIWMAKRMAASMERRAAKTGTKPVMTTHTIHELEINVDYSSEKAARELGYSTRRYENTVRDEIRWLKAAGLI